MEQHERQELASRHAAGRVLERWVKGGKVAASAGLLLAINGCMQPQLSVSIESDPQYAMLRDEHEREHRSYEEQTASDKAHRDIDPYKRHDPKEVLNELKREMGELGSKMSGGGR